MTEAHGDRDAAKKAALAALANAEENGYRPNLRSMTAEQIAVDLQSFDADLEDVPLDVLAEAAAEWLKS